jgi:predicted ABC-type ATPase
MQSRGVTLCYASPQMTRPGQKVRPRCLVVAGPNGAGKTTFAREYLPNEAHVLNFVNADLIAGGLSPLKPELGAIAAGRLVLKEIDRLVEGRSTLRLRAR